MSDAKLLGAVAAGTVAGGLAGVVIDGVHKELTEGPEQEQGEVIAVSAGVGSGLFAAAIRRMG